MKKMEKYIIYNENKLNDKLKNKIKKYLIL